MYLSSSEKDGLHLIKIWQKEEMRQKHHSHDAGSAGEVGLESMIIASIC